MDARNRVEFSYAGNVERISGHGNCLFSFRTPAFPGSQ